MKKQRGSAILIAVFLVAAIGGIAFSFGRVFLLDADTATITENGVSAYYAAESGIEEGFLRYRYNKNSEVPSNAWKLGESKVYRANLRTNIVTTSAYGGISKASPISQSADQTYDLRMGFIGTFGKPFYGQDTTGDGKLNNLVFSGPIKYGSNDGRWGYSFLLIPKDETYKISLDSLRIAQDISNRDISLYANFVKSSSSTSIGDPTMANSIMYVKFTVDYEGDGKKIKEYKAFVTADPGGSNSCAVLGNSPGCQNDLLISTTLGTSPNPGQAWKFDKLISSFFTKIGANPILPQSKVTLSLRPLYNDAYIGLSTQKCLTSSTCAGLALDKNIVVPGPFTTITSTGYFDGATRTIEANIDRQSGTLYDLFDYVIFEKQ